MPLTTSDDVKILLGIPSATNAYDNAITACAMAADAAVRSYLRRGYARTLCPSWPERDTAQTWITSGNNYPDLDIPFVPVISVTSVYFDPRAFYGTGDDAFAADTLLTEGTDYVLVRDDGSSVSASGRLRRLGGRGSTVSASVFGEDHTWMPWNFYTGNHAPGSLAMSGRRPAVWQAGPGNVKVVFASGFSVLPADLTHATAMYAAWLFNQRKQGVPMQSESYEMYSYSLMQPGKSAPPELGTIRQLLARYRLLSI